MTSFGRGEIFALLCAVSWALAVVVFRRCGDEVRPFTLNLFKNVLASVVFVPIVLLVHGISWPAFTGREWLFLAVSWLYPLLQVTVLVFKLLPLLAVLSILV